MNRTASRNGFTLLEMIIAMVIMAVLFTGLYGVYKSSFDMAERIELDGALGQAGRLIINQVSNDLESMYFETNASGSPSGEYRFVAGLDDEENEFEDVGMEVIRFATTSNLDFEQHFPSYRINRVRYLLRRESDEKLRQLIREELPYLGMNGSWSPNEVVLADNVVSFTITFVQEQGFITNEQKVLEEWDSDDMVEDQKKVLPVQASIQLVLEHKGRQAEFLTTLPLIDELVYGKDNSTSSGNS